MSIRYRILLTMIALSWMAIAVSSWLAYRNGRANLQTAVLHGLNGLRRSRAHEIEAYFQMVRDHADSLSDDRMFIDAMQAFHGAYRKVDASRTEIQAQQRVQHYYTKIFLPQLAEFVPLNRKPADYFPVGEAGFKLQDRYVVRPLLPPTPESSQKPNIDSDEYSSAHLEYDPPIRKLTAQFGYDDLLLVEPNNLRIIYSVRKKPDFGTSLKDGPYHGTALAKIVADAAATSDRDAIFIADFASYEPSKGAPSAFLATPIFDGPRRVGVFVVQLSTEHIDNVVSGGHKWVKDGLGQTGDLQLVGSDHFLRSNTREFIEHRAQFLAGLPDKPRERRRIEAYGIVNQVQVPLAAVDKGLAGEEGTIVESNAFKRPTFISFMPLNVEGLKWMLLGRIDVDEALAPVRDFEHTAMLWSLIAVLITIIVALLTTQRLLKPIRALAAAAEKIRHGDLDARVTVHSKDELGLLSSTFNSMAETISRNMETISDKNRENETLLLNILPRPIAERLKRGETEIADQCSEVTVLFADIVGFTSLSANREPKEIVSLLNGLFTQFDAAAQKHGIEKIKTIGDAYMAVCGLPEPRPDHAKQMMLMALDILQLTESYGKALGLPLAIRVGVHTGPVAAGVIGKTKFIYDLWGDTVNMASRMESTGIPGTIQVSVDVHRKLMSEFEFESRGLLEIKGKGACPAWVLKLESVEGQTASATG